MGSRGNGFKTNGNSKIMQHKSPHEILEENKIKLLEIPIYPTIKVNNKYKAKDFEHKKVIIGTHCFCGFPTVPEDSSDTERKHATREHLRSCVLYGEFLLREFADYMRLAPRTEFKRCWNCNFSIFVQLANKKHRCIICRALLEDIPLDIIMRENLKKINRNYKANKTTIVIDKNKINEIIKEK